jgi:Sulfotransferase family
VAEVKQTAGVAAIPPVLVFVGGLHRSGTSFVHRCLAAHPDVAGFSGTGAPEDEGQHLQSVYLPDYRFGGAGRFAFDPAARLTEDSALVSARNRARLVAEWAPYWRRGAAVGVEKSPPNLIRTRFLQALFPRAVFVMVLRHPIAVAGATRKGRRRLLNHETLVHHWVVAHDILAADAGLIRNLHVLRYEHFIADPNAALAPVLAAAGLAPTPVAAAPRTNLNDQYFDRWRTSDRLLSHDDHGRTAALWESAVNRYGYSLTDLHRCDRTQLPTGPSPTGRESGSPRPPTAYELTSKALRLLKPFRRDRRSNPPGTRQDATSQPPSIEAP